MAGVSTEHSLRVPLGELSCPHLHAVAPLVKPLLTRRTPAAARLASGSRPPLDSLSRYANASQASLNKVAHHKRSPHLDGWRPALAERRKPLGLVAAIAAAEVSRVEVALGHEMVAVKRGAPK